MRIFARQIPEMISLPLLDYELKTRTIDGRTEVWDKIRRGWFVFTPEEHVRQLLLLHLIEGLHYPKALIAVEKSLVFAETRLRFDLVVYQRGSLKPWLLAECKAPDIALDDKVLHQLLQYNQKLPECQYWLITNGHQCLCADARDKSQIKWIHELPEY